MEIEALGNPFNPCLQPRGPALQICPDRVLVEVSDVVAGEHAEVEPWEPRQRGELFEGENRLLTLYFILGFDSNRAIEIQLDVRTPPPNAHDYTTSNA